MEARDAAVKKAEEALKKFEADYEYQYTQAKMTWEKRLEQYRNGI